MPSHFCCGFLGGGMFTIACIFFGSSSLCSLEAIKPNIIHENTMNAYLSRFKLMPFFCTFENIIWASIDDYPCHCTL